MPMFFSFTGGVDGKLVHAVGTRSVRPVIVVGEARGHVSRWSLNPTRVAVRVLGENCGQLGDSCGYPELPRRDADKALEVVGELALVRKASVRGDLRQGQVRPCLQEFLGPLDAARDDELVRRQPGA